MLRFDIKPEAARKVAALEGWLELGGFYPFLPPLAWAIAPLCSVNFIQYTHAIFPERLRKTSNSY